MLLSCRTARELPASLSAGDSWAWTVVLDAPVVAGSTLIYCFRPMGGTAGITVTGTLSGDGLSFTFSAVPSDTAKLPPGPVRYSARLTVSSSIGTIRNGTLKVLPNLADPDAIIFTRAEIDLANVLDTMRLIEASSNGSYSGGGVSYTKADLGRLQARADRLRQQVNAEQGKSGAVTIRTVFGSPCGYGGGGY